MPLIIVLIGLISFCFCRGNPVAIPHYLIEGENVLVGITDKGVVVTGSYHFKWNYRFNGPIDPDFTRLEIELPVPMAPDMKDEDAIAAAAPVVTINGKNYSPDPHTAVWMRPNLPTGMKLVVFYFDISDQKLGEKVIAKIQYHQPILKNDRRDMVYYIPLLPFIDGDGKPLNKNSLLINFQSFGDVKLALRTPHEEVIQQTKKLISIRPRHQELIGVERIPAPLEIQLQPGK